MEEVRLVLNVAAGEQPEAEPAEARVPRMEAPSEVLPERHEKAAVQARMVEGLGERDSVEEKPVDPNAVVPRTAKMGPFVPMPGERQCAAHIWDRDQPHQQGGKEP